MCMPSAPKVQPAPVAPVVEPVKPMASPEASSNNTSSVANRMGSRRSLTIDMAAPSGGSGLNIPQ